MAVWIKDNISGPLRQSILFYMAGWAACLVLKVLPCDECWTALVTVEPHQTFLSQLTVVKQKWGHVRVEQHLPSGPDGRQSLGA